MVFCIQKSAANKLHEIWRGYGHSTHILCNIKNTFTGTDEVFYRRRRMVLHMASQFIRLINEIVQLYTRFCTSMLTMRQIG